MRILTMALSVILLTGCVTTGGALANEANSVQFSRPVLVTPSANKTIYVAVSNTAQFQTVNPTQRISSRLAAAGYTITSNPKKAAYQLSVFIHPLNSPQATKRRSRGDIAASTAVGAAIGSLFGGGDGKKAAAIVGGAAGAAYAMSRNSGVIHGKADVLLTESPNAKSRYSRGRQHQTSLLIQRRVDNLNYRQQAAVFTDILAQTLADIMPR
jgi:outer membrane lipoprotein SlyB